MLSLEGGIITPFHYLKSNKKYYNMCLYPKIIRNKKYLPNKKNNFQPPKATDERVLYVAIGCGQCIECRKQKAREWQVRLTEEMKSEAKGYFVTLTFTDKALIELCEGLNNNMANVIAAKAVRFFLERWRKKHGKSLRHWLITEIGGENDRLHMHGIIWTNEEFNNDILHQYWQYGLTYTGDFCTNKTINYIVKYVTKIDDKHKDYVPSIFASAGIGKQYTESMIAKNTYKYRKGQTPEYYTLPNGSKVNLPIYYRNKFFPESIREQLWIDRLNKGNIYVRGIEIRNVETEEGLQDYLNVLQEQQKANTELGFGDSSQEWKKKPYNISFRKLNAKSRLQKVRK